ncbi:MAG TPA: hypothetical protein VHD90_09885 [Phototrophicaceae bacterium]|nr:hypothetical protein [Phototrophicaceae bacterium]
MSRSLLRTAWFALFVVAVSVGVLLLLQAINLSQNLIVQPRAAAVVESSLPSALTDRPLQALYQVEADAAQNGWNSQRSRLAGDLWRDLGDMTQAVSYWAAVDPDASVLRDLAQADIDLGRWADAADTLRQLLTLLPPNSTDLPWAQYQLGLITLTTDPTGAVRLLQAAEPTYTTSVTSLLPAVAGVTDPTRIGVALANAQLWSYAELAFAQAAGDPVALAYGGWVRDMQGKDGTRWIQTAVALAPQNAQVIFLEGLHLRARYDYANSLRAIIQAVALQPDNPALYAELGKAYQLTGDLESAEHWLQYAVSLDSHFQPMLDAFYNDERTTLESLGLTEEPTAPATPDAASTAEP